MSYTRTHSFQCDCSEKENKQDDIGIDGSDIDDDRIFGDAFDDTKNEDKKAIFLNFDSTKVPIVKSGDQNFQRKTFYSPKGEHFVTFTNVTDTSGNVILFGSQPASSSSPYHGDRDEYFGQNLELFPQHIFLVV